jgi:dTDP-4-dehydrorhamnose reductase
MKILLTGATGQLGHALLPVLSKIADVWAPGRSTFDLSRPDTLRQSIREFAPDFIVNPAAYTAVDQAEDESELCFLVNSEAPRVIAEECARLDIPLIHFSTDYVFDGQKHSPYVETDVVSPLGVYGRSKLAGELSIVSANENSVIIRTSWVFDPFYGRNFYRTMVRLFQEREVVSVVDDQVGRPTSVSFLAKETLKLLHLINIRGAGVEGIFHLAEMDPLSWYDFALKIYDWEKENYDFLVSDIVKMSTNDFPTRVMRPAYSVLSNDKWANIAGMTNE